MTPVKSSHIKEIGHDPVTNTLKVHFADGGKYHFKGVSAEKHAALMAAESVGSHFHKNIKGSHEHTKLDD